MSIFINRNLQEGKQYRFMESFCKKDVFHIDDVIYCLKKIKSGLLILDLMKKQYH